MSVKEYQNIIIIIIIITSGNSEFSKVEIKQGIFQGDSLYPLVFVLALVSLSLILRKAKAAYEFQKAKRRFIIFYLWMI